MCSEANQREADKCGLLGLMFEVARLHSSSPSLLTSCFTALAPMCDSGTRFQGVIAFILCCNSLASEENQFEAAKLGALELIKAALEEHAAIAEVARSGLAALEAICEDGHSSI